MNSITLNDVAKEVSDVCMSLMTTSIKLDAANMALAGIQAEMIMLVNQAQQTSVNAISLPGSLKQANTQTTGSAQNTSQNIFPVYFKNTTNVYWDGAKNDNVFLELMIIEDDLQKIIAIMNKCGCGGKGEEKGWLHYLTEIKDIFEDFKFLKELFKAAGLYDLIKKFWKGAEETAAEVAETLENLESLEAVEAVELAESVTALGEGAIAVGEGAIVLGEATAAIAGAVAGIATGAALVVGAAAVAYMVYKAIESDGKKHKLPMPDPIQNGIEPAPDTTTQNNGVEYFSPNSSPNLYAPKGKEGEPYYDNKNNAYHLGTIKSVLHDGMPIYHSDSHIQKYDKEKRNNHRLQEIQFKKDSTHVNGPSTQVRSKSNNTVVNIKIDGLVKQFTVNTTTVQEGAGQIRDLVSHALLGAVKDSVLVAKT